MPAAQFVIFLAVIGQVLLTFMLAGRLAYVRFSIAGKGEVDLSRAPVDTSVWPDEARKVSNCYSNQFETPVLFFAAAAFAFLIGAGDWLSALLAWLYVAARVFHVLIHLGSNNVIRRFQVFLVGLVALLIWWGYLLGHVFGGYLALA